MLGFDGDDPEALVTVAEVIAERTHDSDIDKDQRYAEAISMAQKAIADCGHRRPGASGHSARQDRRLKALLRSNAYSIIGTIEFKKENYPAAQENLQKSIDAFPSEPDPVVVLRLALTLDKQAKVPGSAKVANRAVEMTQDNTPIGTPARRERDRLQQLTGGAAPAPAPAPAAAAATPPKN